MNIVRKPILVISVLVVALATYGCQQDIQLRTVAPEFIDTPFAEELPIAPDFTLPSANTGTNISLSQFQGERHVVLVFYRAYW